MSSLSEERAKEVEEVARGEESEGEKKSGPPSRKNSQASLGEKKSGPPSRKDSQESMASSSESFEKIDKDEADTFLKQDNLPPIRLLGNDLVDNPLPEPRDVPIKPQQQKYYTQDVARSAIGNLIFFSILMFTLPLASMYLSYQYIFTDYFNLSQSEATLDAGFVGVGTVFFVMAAFCYVAYKEEVESEKEERAEKRERGELIEEDEEKKKDK